MKHFRFINESTGLIHPVAIKATSEQDARAFPVPTGHKLIEGEMDHLSQRIDTATGQIVEYQPPRPSQDHEWNSATKRWQLGADALRREQALNQIAALEATQPRAVREALLGRGSTDRLRDIDDQIVALREQLSR